MNARIKERDEILRLERIRTQRLQDLLRHYAKNNHHQRTKQLITPPKKVQPPLYLKNQWREKNKRNQRERANNMGQKKIPYQLKF